MMRRLVPAVLMVAVLCGVGVGGSERATTLAPRVTARDEVRALWVVRDSLATPESVAAVVDQAVRHGFNTLLVQVRGRGDSYFLDGLEPRSHLLATQPASFDPLGVMLRLARQSGLQVHAWVNVNLVASANLLPASRAHVANRHPEWLMVPRPLAQELAHLAPQGPGYVGRLARWTRAQSDVEGLFLSPLVPAAAAHTVAVIEDLVRRYPVDGLHLDYVRFPGPEFDYSRLALEEFGAAVAADVPPTTHASLARQAREDVLAWVDAYPERWAEFRRSRLTALVMRVQTAARRARPGLVVSAAVFPDMRAAYTSRFQDWRLWAESGLLDVLCPMAYTTSLDTFRRQVDEAVRATPPALVWAGIGAYRLSPAETVSHIGAARAAGARGIVLFSYDTIAAAAGGYLGAVQRSAFTAGAGAQ